MALVAPLKPLKRPGEHVVAEQAPREGWGLRLFADAVVYLEIRNRHGNDMKLVKGNREKLVEEGLSAMLRAVCLGDEKAKADFLEIDRRLSRRGSISLAFEATAPLDGSDLGPSG